MSYEIPYFMNIIVKLIIFMNFCDYKICLWGAWCRLCACNLTLAKRLIYYTLGIECAIERFVTMFSAMRLSLGVFNIQSALQSHNIYGNSVLSHFSTFIQCMAVDSHTRSWIKIDNEITFGRAVKLFICSRCFTVMSICIVCRVHGAHTHRFLVMQFPFFLNLLGEW